ncbi:semaphorin-5B isoform X1 [Neophocaena asiaeorientalis asiaeorientalis]|uniref:Semaphorin-5B isoform X1 n=1 Tax=Neophocaena asiaeorientalis asiaeorientalis TaxID=1706337 RepID=A0A341CEF5_NEOAA|nr:semaphorin-5B isoform X1 [Neophocaena asiaeorientalis asiaeorientalis]XP_024612287.1 semaphorin-5B isoform X1 [Neophocaena asiaeorientalis asiaeorientalis]
MVFPGPLAITLLPPSLTLLVVHLASSQDVASEPSSEQQLCSLREHPIVAFADLKPWVSNFTYPGAQDFSQLALDPSRNQLIVGARNYLFRLSLANVSLLQATEWASNEDTRRSCQSKGKTEEECQNYVRVLIVTGRKVFMCGTNAFSPVCSSRQVGNLSRTVEKINGVARCPYDPRHNSTAVISSQGELYAATVIDFSGRDPAIYRSLGSRPPLRTAQYNSKWLNEPNFVAAYDIGLFAYFLLRENAVEHDCGRTVYSRVARVCKNDMGGRFLLEDTWTTFMKARLNCSRPGEVPFYYNELQSAFHLPEQDLIYGVFTTNVNSIAASAVCAFNLSAISQAFNGPFRYQENPRAAWLPISNPIPNFQCGTLPEVGPNENLTERSLQDAQRLFLMSEAVQPVTPEPCVTQDSVRFSHLVVDLVQAKDTLYHVLYIGTESGTILKALSTTSRSLRGCYLEELHVLPPGRREPLRSLRILHSARALFVGLSDGVLRVPLERCAAYRSQGACLGARDPYCGWDGKQQRCSTLEDSSNMSLWTQNITACPGPAPGVCLQVRNVTQDGGFGPWSPWQPCEHLDGDNSGSCLCRARACDSPRPRCGGCDCLGPAIHVANCSRNGAWTPWSSWALCSTSCGIGFQVRQRSCSNPAPRHGGRICVGKSREERFCNENTPCPVPIFWASWGSWSKCSSHCGIGVQSRRRACENGNSCPGCGVEFKTCNHEGCPEVRRNTPWTPWLPVNVTQGGARQEQRFRFTCRAPLADPHGLQFGRRRTETRTCPADGSGACDTDALVEELLRSGGTSPHTVSGGWAAWGPWTSCSRDCELGFRVRKRTCTNPEPRNGGLPCVGDAAEYQDCNPQACPVRGAWSCWTSWSPCSASCGGGHYQRTRSCSSPAPSPGEDICLGLHTEEALCATQACPEGWSPWSEWSPCTEDGVQSRGRYCEELVPGPSTCAGNSSQSRPCPYREMPVILPASSVDEATGCGGFSLLHLVATGISCFVGSGLLTLAVYLYCQHCRHQSQESTLVHPATPNHLHYKGGGAPKNEKYTPMEFKTLNKNNLIPDDRANFYPLQQTNVYTTTYYPSPLNKHSFRPEASPGQRCFPNS